MRLVRVVASACSSGRAWQVIRPGSVSFPLLSACSASSSVGNLRSRARSSSARAVRWVYSFQPPRWLNEPGHTSGRSTPIDFAASAGVPPQLMGLGPIPAVRRVFEKVVLHGRFETICLGRRSR